MYKKIVLIKDTSFGIQDITRDFYTLFFNALHQKNLLEEVQAVRVSDIGIYGQGIVLKILPDNIFYHNVQDSDIERIIEETLKADKVIDELVYQYKPKQVRIVLRNCGKIDPESIHDYIHNGGYQGLNRVICELTPEQVIEEVKKAGLRGRGGAGYPTWLKWSMCRGTESKEKFIICNAVRAIPELYGPQHPGRRSAFGDRGYDHRRLCHRSYQGLFLYPRRVPSGR
jgi:NADH-quinone oxidoreductase subunit F/NADP-reducing hydrogenase subunit HndC